MIELSGYRIDKEIGRGAFATVYLAHSTSTNAPVAIKAVRTSSLTRKLAEALASEIAILRSIRDPHIIRLESLEQRQQSLFLVMEWCEGGDLAQYMRSKGGRLEEKEASFFVHQLALALKTLRKANLVHRDIKPQNLLLSSDFKTLKLADFGFARYVEEDNLAETLCGSPLYMAPEILKYEKYDERADLWSVGAVLYEMLFGRPPFRAQNHIQLLKVIEEAKGVINIPFPVSGLAKSLMLGLLQANPANRLNYSAFLTHPFLATHNSHGVVMDDSELFECRPIPIKKSSSLSSTLSSSPIPNSSLITTAYSSSRTRRRGASVPSSMNASNSLSSSIIREHVECKDDHLIASFPVDCQVSIRKGLILSDLIAKTDNPLLAMQSLRYLILGIKSLSQKHPNYHWLLDQTQRVGEQVDFDWNESEQVEYKVVASLLLYEHSIRVAMEGGFQELLGRLDVARAHYSRSLFILTHFAPIPLHGQTIEDYKRLIDQRLAICIKKLSNSN